MSTVNTTPAEYAEINDNLDLSHPPHKDTVWGNGRVRPTQAATYARNVGAPGWAWSADYFERDGGTGDVEIPQQTCWDTLDTPGPQMSVATAEKVLAAAGELPPGDRRFSLRIAFLRGGKGK